MGSVTSKRTIDSGIDPRVARLVDAARSTMNASRNARGAYKALKAALDISCSDREKSDVLDCIHSMRAFGYIM